MQIHFVHIQLARAEFAKGQFFWKALLCRCRKLYCTSGAEFTKRKIFWKANLPLPQALLYQRELKREICLKGNLARNQNWKFA